MKLRTSTEYAIRILRHLHRHGRDEKVFGAEEIARATGISYPLVAKVTSQLRSHALVRSVQGRNGGHTLGKPAEEIRLYDVFLCMEGSVCTSRCLTKEESCADCKAQDCELYEFFDQLQEKIVRELTSRTIADLTRKNQEEGKKLDEDSNIHRLCDPDFAVFAPTSR